MRILFEVAGIIRFGRLFNTNHKRIIMIEPSLVKKARMSLGLTQKELATNSGVSQSLIAKIESGCLDPTYSKIKNIDEALRKLSAKSEKTALQVMNKPLVYSKNNENVIKIIKLMAKSSISQIPIIENGIVIGLVTESSILENSTKKEFNSLEAKDIMLESPPIISKETPISIIAEILKHSPIALVSAKGIILGAITKADIIKNKA